MGSKLTVMRLYFCLVHPLLRASGKDKTMKRIPKTPNEFDYDLWTTEDGKCMVRVKRTGEQCEVSRETFRILRAEEKKLRRSMTGVPVYGCDDEDSRTTLLSLDYVSYDGGEDMSPSWLEDSFNLEEEVLTQIFVEEFKKELSPIQLSFFKDCILGDECVGVFASKHGIARMTVWRIQKEIRERIKKYF